jgi:hypothetical protein
LEITEAGNHPKVAALVYIAAFALDEGESCASIEQAVPQASKAFKPDSQGNWWIEQEHFAADFAADLPNEKAAFMAVSQVPISTDAFTHKVTSPAWKTKPTWYMVATADRSINPDQERMMAKRAKAKTVHRPVHGVDRRLRKSLVVGVGCLGVLHHRHLVAILHEDIGDGFPAGAVRESSMHQDHVLNLLCHAALPCDNRGSSVPPEI